MLKGERTRLQRYAIESTPAMVYEGCCTWFTILVLSALCNQQGRCRTGRCGISVGWQAGRELALETDWQPTESGRRPHLPLLIALGQHEKCEGAPRLSKSRPPLKWPYRYL